MRSPLIPIWLQEHAAARPDARALATPTHRLTYRDLALRTARLASALHAEGVRPGERVLVALPTGPAFAAASLAIQHLGACAVEVNREWSVDALGTAVRQSEARHAFVAGRDARNWATLAQGSRLERFWVHHPDRPNDALRAALGRPIAAWLREDGTLDPDLGALPEPPPCPARPGDHALVLYTSGSTGQPRGVIQTFGNLDANTRSIVEYLGISGDDQAHSILPLHYCYGRSLFQTHLFTGGSIFLDHRFMYPRVVLEAIGSEGSTNFAGIPATFETLRRLVDVRSIAMPRLRWITQAGGPMRPDTTRWVREVFAPVRLFVMYGQTEATARLAYLPPERGEEKVGSMGVAIPGVELRVVDERAEERPTGQVGELVARGGNVTPGYLDAPEETAAILHDGWLWTGDLAYRDPDGFFFIVGRSKEIMKISGHRVSPVEIENALLAHPAVAEAAVAGVKDPIAGERPFALVVLREGASAAAPELQRHCRERLPAYAVPDVRFVPSVPRNEAGKLLRAQVAQQLSDLLASEETR